MCKFIFLWIATLAFASWTPPALIDSSTIAAKIDVTTCYDSALNRVFAAWVDNATNRPTYSIYSSGSWSTPAYIGGGTLAANNNVFLCYDSQNAQVFAAWRETSDSDFPYYSIYSSGSWSAPAAILSSGLGDAVSGDDVFLCYDSTHDLVFATWVGNGRSSPAACIYNGSWGSRTQIHASSFPTRNVYTCFNSTDGTVIATWPNPGGSSILYAIYDGSWGSASTLASSVTTVNVFPCYNSTDQTIFATWINTASDIHASAYSIFSGGAWGTPAAITATSVKGASQTLFACYNSANNQVFAVWANSSSAPTYTIYSSGAWSSSELIDAGTPAVYHDIALSYGSTDNNVFATFGNDDDQLPYYSIYTSENPPSHLTGAQYINDFGVQKEYYNQLNWSPSSSPDVAGYSIYRDGTRIASVSSLSYQDHNRIPGTAYTYTVYAFDSSGTESTGISTTVR